MDQAALKNERQIKPENVVPHQLVGLTIEIFHKLYERRQRSLFVLFKAIVIYTKHPFCRWLFNSEIKAGNRTGVHRDREQAAGSRAQRPKLITAFLLGRDVFQIT